MGNNGYNSAKGFLFSIKKTYLDTSGNIKYAKCYPQNDVARYKKKYSNPACLVSDLQAKIDAQLYLDFSEENTPTFVIEYQQI